MAKIAVGQQAPDFKLPDQNGKVHELKDYSGKWLLLYFYPRDNTPGCTTEACELRDNFSSLSKHNAQVLGISGDSIKSHASFAEKFKLPFPLLADENKELIKAYGVLVEKSMFGKKYLGIARSSFLIDPQGKIVKIYDKVKPNSHARDVLKDLLELSDR